MFTKQPGGKKISNIDRTKNVEGDGVHKLTLYGDQHNIFMFINAELLILKANFIVAMDDCMKC